MPAARSCHGPSGTSLGIMGCIGFCDFVFGTDFPVFYILCDVWIHALQIYIFSLARCCTFLISLWPSCNSLSILWYNSEGIHTLASFQ